MSVIHEMSVSGNPRAEASARLLKAVSELHYDWLEGERKRGVAPSDVVEGMIQSHVGLAHLVGIQMSGKDDASVLRALAEDYREMFLSFADYIDKHGKKSCQS
jgi:hypothetical protein